MRLSIEMRGNLIQPTAEHEWLIPEQAYGVSDQNG
jgi:hypothetical protein